MYNGIKDQTEADAFLANDIVKLLREHDRGRLSEQLERQLHQVIQAVTKHGKKGSLTLKLSFSPEEDEDGTVERVDVKPDISLVIPQPGSPTKGYFTTKNGGLSRTHPNQLTLDV